MEPTDGASPHVLVIDDEPSIRGVICEVLTEEGYRVSSATTYFDDLDLVVRLEPDLVILDIVLGGKQAGMDFLETVKADPRTARIPIAVCTAANHLTEQIQARLTEWDCLLICKPFDLDDFLAEINRCLHQHDLVPATA
jgi:two-component system, OmpR family, response regulator VicR